MEVLGRDHRFETEPFKTDCNVHCNDDSEAEVNVSKLMEPCAEFKGQVQDSDSNDYGSAFDVGVFEGKLRLVHAGGINNEMLEDKLDGPVHSGGLKQESQHSDAGQWQEGKERVLKHVEDKYHAEICRLSTRQSRQVMAFSRATNFNQLITLDLKTRHKKKDEGYVYDGYGDGDGSLKMMAMEVRLEMTKMIARVTLKMKLMIMKMKILKMMDMKIEMEVRKMIVMVTLKTMLMCMKMKVEVLKMMAMKMKMERLRMIIMGMKMKPKIRD